MTMAINTYYSPLFRHLETQLLENIQAIVLDIAYRMLNHMFRLEGPSYCKNKFKLNISFWWHFHEYTINASEHIHIIETKHITASEWPQCRHF